MQRLAALVPRPRLHLIRFHGVLAPHAKLRAAIVPDAVQETSEPAQDHAHGQSARMSWAHLRVFDIDIEHCPNCGGRLKIIAAPSTSSGQASTSSGQASTSSGQASTSSGQALKSRP